MNMSSIAELYTAVYEKLKSIKTRSDGVDLQLSAARDQDAALREARIENLQLQLKRIDEYAEKVDYFRKMAERHLESRNLLTITPRELNFNRLRNWAMLIDPSLTDDPYAQRIYVQARCNEMFLERKREQFQQTLEELEQSGGALDEAALAAAKRLKTQLEEECRAVVEGDEFRKLATVLTERHGQYVENPLLQTVRTEGPDPGAVVGLGVYAQPLPMPEAVRPAAKARLGEYYDAAGSSILLPVEHELEKEVIVSVSCTAAKERKLYRGLQNYLLNVIGRTPVGSRRISVLDALHFNSTALGYLRPLEDSPALDAVPKDLESLVDKLREIVSSFSDTDEALGLCDSVREFNAAAKPEERLERRILVLIGYPSAFSGAATEYIKRILLNYEHYGISIVLMDTQFVEKQGDRQDIPVDIVENIFRVQMTRQKETVQRDQGGVYHYRWYELRQDLSEAFVSEVRSHAEKSDARGTEYVKRRPEIYEPPLYTRGKKSISLPYGVDAKDEMHSLSFDNENFAAFLMGASGSGKSTMLHALITGILLDYHPDDVELWLADFKMSEFAQYIDPLPPHVKYILLDESAELVYDLIDQLTEKMMERQRFFMKHRDMKKVENVPSDIYMPVIFVILDEFSIMSQVVSESEAYKLRLQNLLAKGRALGIKFIFASQTFTKGIQGLTATAKDQIQTRIAMKNSYNEINETLELSSAVRTEQVKNWMDALPPHVALSKYREGESLRVKRLQVMYFKGRGEETLEPQRSLINRINDRLRPVEEYCPGDPGTYVDKHPVIVDGNSYQAFRMERVSEKIEAYKRAHTGDVAGDDAVLVLGSPRRMVDTKYAVVTGESRENLLLIARAAEQSCAMSLIMSAARCLEDQGWSVRFWAYGKNRLYRTYKDSHLTAYPVAEGMEEICREIRDVRERIGRKEAGRELIVLLGMEQICGDFELIDFAGGGPARGSVRLDASKLQPKNEEEQAMAAEASDLYALFMEEYDIDSLEDQWIEQGLSNEEMMEENDRLFEEFKRKRGILPPPEAEEAEEPAEEAPEDIPQEEPEEEAAYDASEDFKYIIRQGSRFGYHFLLCLNNLSDMRATKLQAELFRHRLTFQLPADDSLTLFANRSAAQLPEHICQYSDTLEQYTLRPFLHEGIGWDGWDVDADGEAVNSAFL